MHGFHHQACGVFIPKIRISASRRMYVIGRIEVEESVSILSLEEPTVSFSLEEFDHYADLFEEMLERMDREEAEGEDIEKQWSPALNEFDLTEIADLRERYDLIREA